MKKLFLNCISILLKILRDSIDPVLIITLLIYAGNYISNYEEVVKRDKFYPNPDDYSQFNCNDVFHPFDMPMRCYEGDSVVNFKVESDDTFWDELYSSFSRRKRNFKQSWFLIIDDYIKTLGYESIFNAEDRIFRSFVDDENKRGNRIFVNGTITGKIAKVDVNGKVTEFILSEGFIINNEYGIIYVPQGGREGVSQLNRISDALLKSTKIGTSSFKNGQELETARILGRLFSVLYVFTLILVFFNFFGKLITFIYEKFKTTNRDVFLKIFKDSFKYALAITFFFHLYNFIFNNYSISELGIGYILGDLFATLILSTLMCLILNLLFKLIKVIYKKLKSAK